MRGKANHESEEPGDLPSVSYVNDFREKSPD